MFSLGLPLDICAQISSFKDCRQIGLGPTLMYLILTYPFKDPVSKYSHSEGSGGEDYMSFGGGVTQFSSYQMVLMNFVFPMLLLMSTNNILISAITGISFYLIFYSYFLLLIMPTTYH